MAGNSFGGLLKLTSFGESHGSCIGGVLDGMPPLIPFDIDFIQHGLDQRRPGRSTFHTPRTEMDKIHILSGIYQGMTTGTPIAFQIFNENQRSSDYSPYEQIFRPGHGDFSYYKKYGIWDPRGGGRASARETAVRVAAGQMALLGLRFFYPDINIQGAVIQIGSHSIQGKIDWNFSEGNDFFCPDPNSLPIWMDALTNAKQCHVSLGAKIYVEAIGCPAGLGEPVYDKLDADLAKAMMSINAVKAVEIGDGVGCVEATQGFDEMNSSGFFSNRSGGILAGISTGEPITCTVSLKPTSSTKQPRKTIDVAGQVHRININGRHDPCVGIRAVPIAKAMMSLTLLDHLLRWRGIKKCKNPVNTQIT
jgi:chorismate synthase